MFIPLLTNIETTWMDEDRLCHGLKIGSLCLYFSRIFFHEIDSIQSQVICIGSSQGYGPLITVTITSNNRKKITLPIHSDSKEEVVFLSEILRRAGIEKADSLTVDAVKHGPRMLFEGDCISSQNQERQ